MLTISMFSKSRTYCISSLISSKMMLNKPASEHLDGHIIWRALETGSPLALLLCFANFGPRVIGNQIMPVKLARRTPAHRMLERLQHARCFHILEVLHGLHQTVRSIQEHLELYPPSVWVAVCILVFLDHIRHMNEFLEETGTKGDSPRGKAGFH
jgi:hypothetical protein